MEVGSLFLVDKSALARIPNPRVASALEPLILQGVVATCGIVDLEVLYSARNYKNFQEVFEERMGFVHLDTLQRDFDRAVNVMSLLAKTGHHRSVSIPDLLIAAVAEREAMTVLHYDEDFDRIAAVTEQSVQWVVPRGSL